jgi:hypothetical protein
MIFHIRIFTNGLTTITSRKRNLPQDLDAHIFVSKVYHKVFSIVPSFYSVTQISAGVLPGWSTAYRSCFGTGAQ